MRKLLFVFGITMALCVNNLAQVSDLTLDNGVKPNKEIDAIYATFAKGYRQLNVDLVADLYTDDANYLASGSSIIDGRKAIYDNFAGFFSSVKSSGNTMEIKFKILNRDVDKRIGYELGIYTLNTFKDGKQVDSSQGKFFVVTKKIGKKWYFRFDGYSNLKPENR